MWDPSTTSGRLSASRRNSSAVIRRISHPSGFRALRDFAPFGISRPSEFGAVRNLALLQDLTPLGVQRERAMRPAGEREPAFAPFQLEEPPRRRVRRMVPLSQHESPDRSHPMRSLMFPLALCAIAAPASAQLTTTYTGTQRDGDKNVPATAEFTVQNGRALMVMKGSHAMRMIFDARAQVLHILSDDDKSFFDI